MDNPETPKPAEPPKYMLLCQQCKYKRFTNGDDLQDLKVIPESPFQKGTVKYDPKSRTTYVPPKIQRRKLFRCPNCGFAMRAYDPHKRMEEKP